MSKIYNLTRSMHPKEMARGNIVLDRAIEQRHLGNEIARNRQIISQLAGLEVLEFEAQDYLNRLSNQLDAQNAAVRELYPMFSKLHEIRNQAKADLPKLIAHSELFSALKDAHRLEDARSKKLNNSNKEPDHG